LATSQWTVSPNLGCADNGLVALRRHCFYLALPLQTCPVSNLVGLNRRASTTPRPSVRQAHRSSALAPGEREHSDPKGTRVRVQRGDRLTAAPGTGAVIAIAEDESLSRVPPATSSAVSARGIEAGTAETRSGSVHESPVRRSRTRPPKSRTNQPARTSQPIGINAIRHS
jgi:hypothetical protein